MKNHRINSYEITKQPTEDKYSMAPLYIKGFLPQQNGSAIMLPAEITTLSGSDFDVDKLYIMLPEFKVKKNYDIRKAWDDFYKDPENSDIVKEIDKNLELSFKDYQDKHPEDEDIDIDDYIDWIHEQGVKKYQFSDTAQERFSSWFKSRKQDYYLGSRIIEEKYDYDKLPQEQSLEKRNNALIDLMWGVLTNPDTASKMLNPGSFDKQKAADRVVTILSSMTEKQLADEGYTSQQLLELPLEPLDKLAKKYKKKLDPLSPRTQVVLHQQNVTGGKMIGVYANHNANHAIMQHVDGFGVDDKYGAFNFAGIRRTRLNLARNEKGEYISRNTSNFLAASVDNVKDNTLYGTNQNLFTGDPSMLLSRLGYNPIEIAILMRQPIIMEMTRRYFREKREGKSKDTIIEEVIKKTAEFANMKDNLSWGDVKGNLFKLDTLMGDIQKHKEVADMSDKDKEQFYRRQAAVGVLFQRIMKTASALSDLVAATRSDTDAGAAGPTIADTIIKIQKVEDFIENAQGERFPLVNADVILTDIPYDMNDVDGLREALLKSKLPYIQAFYTLGVKWTEKMLASYFPHFTKPFKEVLNGREESDGKGAVAGLKDYTKNGKLNVKTINSIYNDLLAYIMSNLEFFGTGKNRYGKEVSVTEKRRDFINNFPTYFKKVINDPKNEDIASLGLIQRLKVVRSSEKNPVDVTVFKNVGKLTSVLRERYMRDWATLLYMRNPEAQKLALNMFLYSYFRNGFAFGPSSFIHLAPTAIRDAINDYIPTLRKLLNTTDDYTQFIEQYIYNHLDNRSFVPEVPSTSTASFTTLPKNKGDILDEVTVHVNKNSSSADKSIVRKEDRDENDEPIYDFFKFIGRNINGKWYYYKLVESSDYSARYARIEPLGYKYSFLEYEYGVDAEDVETVIAKNKKDYDPIAEFAAMHTPSQLTDEELASAPDYSEAYSAEALANMANSAAYGAVYNEPPAADTSSDNITNIPPNNSYRDANDDSVCGAGEVVWTL